MIVSAVKLEEYFQEALSSALQKSHLKLTDEAKAYVVRLLSEFSRSENVYAGVGYGEKQSLSLLLLQAQEAAPPEALRILRHIGDSSLYLLGFFSDSSSAKFVGPDYYIVIGETAYSSVAGLVREQSLAAIYHELAKEFGGLVDLLNTISFYGQKHGDIGQNSAGYLLELVERYKRTQNPNLLEILKANGLCIKHDKTEIH